MEFQLLREKLKNDIAATQMYRSKLECHETLLYHAKVEHTRKRRLQALDAVEELFKVLWPSFPSLPQWSML